MSAVYDISATQPFPDNITVELEHCVDLKDNNEASLLQMSFAVADTKHGPPYQFHTLAGGRFGVGQYGRIQLNRFSMLVMLMDNIKWYAGYPICFFAGMYYRPDNRVLFVAARNLEAHIHAIEDEYKSEKDPEKFSLMCSYNCSSIELEIPKKSKSNWKVIPCVNPPKIKMAEILDYQPRKLIPQIGLRLKRKGKGVAREGLAEVRVTAAPDDFKDIFLLCNATSVAHPLQPVQPLQMTETSPSLSQMQPLIRQGPPLQPLQHSPVAEGVPQSPPSQGQHPTSQEDKPDMVTLMKFHTPNGDIDIIEQVSPYYRKVGTFLLNDETGNKINAIKVSCHDEVNEITHNIFKKWINENPDATWSKLIQCLEYAELCSLAKKIKDTFSNATQNS